MHGRADRMLRALARFLKIIKVDGPEQIIDNEGIYTFLVIWPTVTGPLPIKELHESLEKRGFLKKPNRKTNWKKDTMLTSFSQASIILDLIAIILYHPR